MSPIELHKTSKECCDNHLNRNSTHFSNEKTIHPPSEERLLNEYAAGTLPPSVTKQVLKAGEITSTLHPYARGTRMFFHFETVDTETGTAYDDTRTLPKPMELIFNKKFKIPIWELALQTMRKWEMSSFRVPKELCLSYPTAAKVIREANQPGERPKQKSPCCCGQQLLNGNITGDTGHSDLDSFIQRPRDLTFTFEILDVNLPGQYDMEACYMTDQEKADSVPTLRNEGNILFSRFQFSAAAAKYEEAGSRLEHLILKERPGSELFQELTLQKVPILLNLAFALIKLGNYYEALRRCTAALEIDPDNAKGLFRRALCHKGIGSYDEAEKDFKRALSLDRTLKKSVKEQLGDLVALEKRHNDKLKDSLKKLF